MNPLSPDVRKLARRLITLESPRDTASPACGQQAVKACDKLRVPLAKLAGVAGFRSLISRALALAKAEVPALDPVKVNPDGSLEGFDGNEQNQDVEAGVAVVAQLLGLLVTFVGEPLSRSLVRDAWPDAFVAGIDAEGGEKS